jgi:hypothetical protein
MTRSAVFFIALTALLLFAAHPSVAAGTPPPGNDTYVNDALTDEARQLFLRERFSELEGMATGFRHDKSCTVEGTSKLELFYEAFSKGLGDRPSPETERAYQAAFDLMDKWAREFPNSVTERTAEAGVWTDYAWIARGKGYANTVTDDGWRLYDERIKRAYGLLEKKPLPPAEDCPQRYAALLTVGMAQSWDRKDYDDIFSEGVALDPVYYALYRQKAIYLLPRWHGGPGDWQRFAGESVRLTPKSEGMSAYAVVASATQRYGEWNYFEESGIEWPKMKQGYADLLKQYPDSSRILNRYAMYAVMANDREAARPLLGRIGENPCMSVWKERPYYDYCRGLVASGKDYPVPENVKQGRAFQLAYQAVKSAAYFSKFVFSTTPGLGLLASFMYAVMM